MHLTVESSINRTSANLIGLTYWALSHAHFERRDLQLLAAVPPATEFSLSVRKNVCFVFDMTLDSGFNVMSSLVFFLHLQ